MKRVHVIILIAFSLFLLAGATLGIFWPQLFPSEEPRPEEASKEVEVVEEVAKAPEPEFHCPIDGEATSEDKIHRRPIGIMIENTAEARPQSGLSKACVVYETVAEGGVTRFLAIFLHDDADDIGPVRSAREGFVYLLKQYNAIYAHCGVGPNSLTGTIKNLGIPDLDQFVYSEPYWRIRTRKAPHNLYTSTEGLRKTAGKKGYDQEVSYQKPNFKNDDPIEQRPLSGTIDIKFSRPVFDVHYDYDRESNSYKRSVAGNPHMDAASNQQLSPKNVVVQYTSIYTMDNKGRVRIDSVGSGNAIVFQDGKAIIATWERQTLSDMTRFYDENGNEIKFNPGQIWFEVIDSNKMKATYSLGTETEAAN